MNPRTITKIKMCFERFLNVEALDEGKENEIAQPSKDFNTIIVLCVNVGLVLNQTLYHRKIAIYGSTHQSSKA